MNLGPPASNSSNQGPHQTGRARGFRGQVAPVPIAVAVEWLIDSGAEVGTIRQQLAAKFALSAHGATASGTAGGVAMGIHSGIDVEFTAEDPSGTSHTVRVSRPVAVKPNNLGSDIIGMDQLASAAVTMEWDPAVQRGALRIAAPAVASGLGPPPASRPAATPETPLKIVDHGTWIDIGGVRVEKRLIEP